MRIKELQDYQKNMAELEAYRSTGLSPEGVQRMLSAGVVYPDDEGRAPLPMGEGDDYQGEQERVGGYLM